MKFIKNSRSK